ncbi:hypothetical protein EV359DRAFT_62444 [Lentinula novae-zelandiae]|nr:hypothetical protein EV359DRAFT_62444 [Lentinula novae-zelandiae]
MLLVLPPCPPLTSYLALLSPDTVASPSSTQIVTHHRAALLADIVHNFDELPLELDITQSFYQIPTSSRHLSMPSSSDSDFYPAYTYKAIMPPALLDDTVTYTKWKPSGNGMPGNMSCGKITNRDEFAKLDFEKFFLVLWDRVLEHDWQDSTFRKMHAIRMPDSLTTSVSDLAVQLLVLNNLLQGTPRFQSEENLKIMLIDTTDSHLCEAYNKEVEDHAANPAHGIHLKDFNTFMKAIQVLDNSRHHQLLA